MPSYQNRIHRRLFFLLPQFIAGPGSEEKHQDMRHNLYIENAVKPGDNYLL
jgi:hypothetical protein